MVYVASARAAVAASACSADPERTNAKRRRVWGVSKEEDGVAAAGGGGFKGRLIVEEEAVDDCICAIRREEWQSVALEQRTRFVQRRFVSLHVL